MATFTRQFLDDLQNRVDAVQLVGQSVELKPSGNNFKGLCPFHPEKTPSFHVYPNDQSYHCFGCGAHGSMIDFVMKQRNLPFPEAVSALAEMVGLPLPEKGNQRRRPEELHQFKKLHQAMEAADTYYQSQLNLQSPCGEYLRSRGIDSHTANRYGLGFAPDSFNSIKAHLARFDTPSLLQCGLLATNSRGSVYDRFRNRLMFPIRDIRGRTIGFGGRVISNDQVPKYLNSPQTKLFDKGNQLYGLHEAKQADTRSQNLIVVEGYLDVVTLAQHGIHNAVAPLGTALTRGHVDLMSKHTSEYVLCFDGDEAGTKATWRALTMSYACLKQGRRIRVARLPEGYDPDSYVREFGKESFMKLVDDAPNSSKYFFEELSSKYDLDETEELVQMVDEARAVIKGITHEVYRESMYKKLSELTSLPIDGLRQEKRSAAPYTYSKSFQSTTTKRVEKFPNERLRAGESNALKYLIHNVEIAHLIDSSRMKSIQHLKKDSILFRMITTIRNNDIKNISQLIASYDDDSKYRRILIHYSEGNPSGLKQESADAFLNAIDALIHMFNNERNKNDSE